MAADARPQGPPILLDDVEVRVLGSLLEKEITTPEYYPLTLNALMNACNQKSNRFPETTYNENSVREALARLRSMGLLLETTGAGHRVPKYSQRFTEVLNLGRREQALLCELMVRGPQTLGELRSRSERMHAFSDLEEVEACLRHLAEHPRQALVKQLPRQPGTKENRYAQLLAGEPAVEIAEARSDETRLDAESQRAGMADRVAALEANVRELHGEMNELKQQLAAFRRQFE